MEMLFFELKLSEKVGKVLERAAQKIHADPRELLRTWWDTKLAGDVLAFDAATAAQSAAYILELFEEELDAKHITLKGAQKAWNTGDLLYWAGYVTTYMALYKDIPAERLNQYDLGWLCDNYEVLHTLGVKQVIEELEERV